MPYNRGNHLKRAGYILRVYREVKEADVPDTRIVAHIFPRHNIFISYRQWMNIKNMSRREPVEAQLCLF